MTKPSPQAQRIRKNETMPLPIPHRRYGLFYCMMFVLTFGLTSDSHLVAQAKPTTADFAAIDTYLAGQLKEWHIPGLTVISMKILLTGQAFY
jgi:hypothetical protein